MLYVAGGAVHAVVITLPSSGRFEVSSSPNSHVNQIDFSPVIINQDSMQWPVIRGIRLVAKAGLL